MDEFVLVFDGRSIPGDYLKLIAGPVADKLALTAPRLAEWLSAWCAAEGEWRTREPSRRPREHAEALPDVEDWNNVELAGALRAITSFSYAENLHPVIGELVDRLLIYITEEAAGRLERQL